MVRFFMQKKKLRLKEVQSLAQGHTASRWGSWVLDPFLSDQRAWALTHSNVGLLQTHEDWSRVVGAGTKRPRGVLHNCERVARYQTSSAFWDGPQCYPPRHHEACSNFEVLGDLGFILKAETQLFAPSPFFLKVGGICSPTEMGTFPTLILRLRPLHLLSSPGMP